MQPASGKRQRPAGFYDRLERRLGVADQAEACEFWSSEADHYVYVYFDPMQIGRPVVYVGIGKGGRRVGHWTNTHNAILAQWIEYWKDEGLSAEDVSAVIAEGLTQRQAAAVETYFIDRTKAEANIVRYWCPDMSYERSEMERRTYSRIRSGRKKRQEVIDKSARSLSNKLTLDLYRGDELIRRFRNTSASVIAEWIRSELGADVYAAGLWHTVRSTHLHRGFRLKVVGAAPPDLDPLTVIKKSIAGQAVLAKGVDGQLRVFVSLQSAAQKLDIVAPNIAHALKGKRPQAGNYTFRYLTDAEIERNIERWPVYYRICVDGVEHRVLNMTAFCESQRLKQTSVRKVISAGGYCISGGKRVEGEIVRNHESLEILGADVDDDLPTPVLVERAPAERQSGHRGVSWNTLQQKWAVLVVINNRQVGFGRTDHLDVAIEVADWVYQRIDDPDVVQRGRGLMERLRTQAGEVTRANSKGNYGVRGVGWDGRRKQWTVAVGVNGKQTKFGRCADKQIAAQVAEWVHQNLDDPDVVAKGRALMRDLKARAGEATHPAG